MSLPIDFIGIGSGKCGSTWLYENIAKHPEICNCNLKELNYFSDLYDAKSLDWYMSQFSSCASGMKRGEFSVTYLSHFKAAERIHRHFPDARLLAIVRSPVKRAYSNYLHSIRKGDIPSNVPFSEYIADEERLMPGRYVDHLKSFYDYFDPSQIMVVLTENFLKNPVESYRAVFEHIGVKDVNFLPLEYSQRRNEAKSYRFLWLENVLVRSYRHLSKQGYTKLVKHITNSGIGEKIRKVNSSNRALPPMDEASQKKLLDYYAPYNYKLEALLGKSLASWGKLVDK